ncbi:unnamed protein product [Peronospora effusa]|nr:unnamed protein product [Peronospora effusa]
MHSCLRLDRQYKYVRQYLTLWREIAHDMFCLWCLTDEDLLTDVTRYELTDTGQGLHCIQPAPRVSRAMHVILHSTMRSLDSWVGHILRPIVKAIDSIESMCESPKTRGYVDTTFGGARTLKHTILADFFRKASAWNWCSNLHSKPFFPIFKITGFVGFDGKFG